MADRTSTLRIDGSKARREISDVGQLLDNFEKQLGNLVVDIKVNDSALDEISALSDLVNEITIDLNVNDAALGQAKQDIQALSAEKIEPALAVDPRGLDGARQEINALDAEKIEPALAVDPRGLNDARQEINALDAEVIAPKISVDKTPLGEARKEIEKLGNEKPTVKVDADTNNARSELGRFVSQAKGEKITVEVDADISRLEAVFAGTFFADLAGNAAAQFTGALSEGLGAEGLTDKLEGQLGLTVEEAERLGGLASDVYRGAWGENLEQVYEAIRAIAPEMGDLANVSDAELQKITTQALDIASAFDVDVTDAVRAASAQVANGLAPDFESAFDVITKGFQDLGPRGQDLLEVFEEYSVAFSDIGISSEAALGFMVGGLDGGARAADGVADALKELFLRITEDSDGPNQALQDIGLSADGLREAIAKGGPAAEEAMQSVFQAISSIEDPTERARVAQELLGGTFEQVGLDGIEGMANAELAVEGLEGATERLSESINSNLGVTFEELKRTAIGFAVDVITDTVLPALGQFAGFFVENILPTLQDFGDFILTNVIPALTDFGGVMVDTLGPAISTIFGFFRDDLLPAIGDIASAFVEKLTPVFEAFGTTLTDTVGPAINDMYTAFADILGPFLQDVLVPFFEEKLIPAFAGMVDIMLNEVLPVVVEIASEVLPILLEALVAVATWVIEDLIPALESMYSYFVDNILPVLTDVANFIVETVGPAIVDLGFFITDDLIPALTDMWSYFSENILPILEDVATFMVETLGAAITDVAGFFIDDLLPAATDIYNFFTDDLLPIITDVANFFLDFFIPATEDVGLAFDALLLVAETVWSGIETAIDTAWTAISGIWDLMNAAADLVGVGQETLETTTSTAWEGLKTSIDTQWGLINGIWDLMKAGADALGINQETLKGTVDTAWAGIQTAISTAAGIIEGILSALGTAADVLGQAFTAAQGVISTAVATAATAVSGASTAINSALGLIETALGALKDAFQAAKDFISGIFDGLSVGAPDLGALSSAAQTAANLWATITGSSAPAGKVPLGPATPSGNTNTSSGQPSNAFGWGGTISQPTMALIGELGGRESVVPEYAPLSRVYEILGETNLLGRIERDLASRLQATSVQPRGGDGGHFSGGVVNQNLAFTIQDRGSSMEAKRLQAREIAQQTKAASMAASTKRGTWAR